MNKVLVIGNAGSGKTFFSRLLANKTNLPLVHLDKLYWCGNWQHLSREEFDTVLQNELEKSKWIIDGNFNRTIPHRLNYCDTVFYFDFPVISCLFGITKRIIQNYGKAREDMGGRCTEYFDKQKFSLYRNAVTFNKEHRKEYYRLLEAAKNVRVIVFKSRKQAKNFLNSLGESL